MKAMFAKALWDIRWTAFWYAAGGALYVFAIGLFFPTIRAQAESFEQLLASYPKALLTLVGYTDITTFSGFMGTETLNLVVPAVFIVFATLSGAGVVAKEIEDGTSELWLSVPARRWRLLLAKLGALAVGLMGMVLAVVIAVGVSAIAVDVTVQYQNLLALATVMAVFLLVIAAYSSLLSALTSSRGRAAGISLGVTLGFYLVWVVGSLAESWRWLKSLSIFSAYQPQDALASGSAELAPLAVLLAITAACTALALAVFERRDAVA